MLDMETVGHYERLVKPISIVNNYWQHFGLNQPPFEESSQYAMFYPLPQWQEYLTFLQKFHCYPQPLVLMVGELGIGKSTLITQYMAQMNNEIVINLVKSHSALRIPEILQAIAKEFGVSIPPSSTANPYFSQQDQITALANAISQTHKPGVVVLDDAHRLPLETLSAMVQLSLIQADTAGPLRLLLTGEAQLENRIKNLFEISGRRMEFPVFTLKPLNFEQTRSYLKFRLSKAGLNENTLFKDEDVQRIYKLSAGIPGRINLIAKQSLIEMSQRIPIDTDTEQVRSKSGYSFTITPQIPQWVSKHFVRTISIVLLVLIFALLWLWPHSRHHANIINEHANIQTAPFVPPAAPSPPSQPRIKPPEPVALSAPPSPVVEKSHDANLQNHALQNVMSNPPPNEAAVSAVANHQVGSQNTTDIKQPKPPLLQNDKAVISAPPAPIRNITHSAPVTSQHNNNLSQKYTLQLMASQKLKDITYYIDKNNLNSVASFFKTDRQGQTWYVLVYGEYATLAQAKAAIAKLPENLQEKKPWVRTFASLKSSKAAE